MENIVLRSCESNSALVSATDDLEKTIHQPNDTKPFTTVWGEKSISDTPVGPSNQPSTMEKDRSTTEFRGLFSSQTELQLLRAAGLKKLDSFVLKGAMMQETKETLAEAVYLGFLATATGAKYAFYLFSEMALTIMVSHGLMNKLIHNNFERWA